MKKLAIAMDMDETAMSSFRYGSPQPNYDTISMYRNEILGSQTALKPMLNLFKPARKRGMATFVITARYEPISADPLVGALMGSADLCSSSLAWTGACGLDINTFNFTKVTWANLKDEGYTGLTDLLRARRIRKARARSELGTGRNLAASRLPDHRHVRRPEQ